MLRGSVAGGSGSGNARRAYCPAPKSGDREERRQAQLVNVTMPIGTCGEMVGDDAITIDNGLSSGIGAVYADRQAKHRYDLILVARNLTRLVTLAGVLLISSLLGSRTKSDSRRCSSAPASFSSSSAVRSRASQIVGLSACSANLRYHAARSRSFCA